jgi:hypothetical protein
MSENGAITEPSLALSDLVNAGVLARLDALAETYRDNQPFRHIVIDDFLRPEITAFACARFPALEDMPTIFKEPMAYKGQLSDVAGRAPALAPIFATLQAPAFRAVIERISGIAKLIDDPALAGGGLHQSPRSGFLDLHVDANYHPFDKSLHRRVNLLIYLSRDWSQAWGGELQLWSDRDNRPAEKLRSVAPLFNRAVIFSTTRTSWHGVGPIACPEGQTRRSLALYYYTKERPADELYRDSSVIWMNRSVLWKRALYPLMNFAIAKLRPYSFAKRLRAGAFDSVKKMGS